MRFAFLTPDPDYPEPCDWAFDVEAEAVRARGVEVDRFQPEEFPSAAEVSSAYSPAGGARTTLRFAGRSVDLGRVTAVWHRHPRPPSPHEEIADPALRRAVRDDVSPAEAAEPDRALAA